MEAITRHAAARMQQRGISSCILEALMTCGSETHDHRGATILYFDKRAQARVQKQFSIQLFTKMEGHLNTYAVIGDNGAVLTVGDRKSVV